MEKGLFTLAQQDFALFLNRLARGLNNEHIEYILVGGIAVQAHVANALTTQYKNPLLDLEGKVENLRLQDNFRATDDVNICLREGNIQDAKKVLIALEYVVKESDGTFYSPDEKGIVEIEQLRASHVNADFSLTMDGKNKRKLQVRFHRNERKAKTAGDLSELPEKLYEELFDNQIPLNILYHAGSEEDETKRLYLKVASPEDLIFIKLAQGRPKDIADITSLLMHRESAGLSIDEGRIRTVLSEPHPKYKQNENLLKAYKHFQGIMEALRQ